MSTVGHSPICTAVTHKFHTSNIWNSYARSPEMTLRTLAYRIQQGSLDCAPVFLAYSVLGVQQVNKTCHKGRNDVSASSSHCCANLDSFMALQSTVSRRWFTGLLFFCDQIFSHHFHSLLPFFGPQWIETGKFCVSKRAFSLLS